VLYQRLQEFLDTYPDYYSAFENWLNNNSTSPRSPLTSPICPNVGVQTSPINEGSKSNINVRDVSVQTENNSPLFVEWVPKFTDNAQDSPL
jgi:hypothetical protein